jgi:hypothetical protein
MRILLCAAVRSEMDRSATIRDRGRIEKRFYNCTVSARADKGAVGRPVVDWQREVDKRGSLRLGTLRVEANTDHDV